MISVRLTTDLQQIETLDKKLFPTDEPYPHQTALWWIARSSGRTAGFCGLKIFEKDGFAFLCRSGVVPRYRGYGVHRTMIKRRIDYARRHGLGSVISYTKPDNPASGNNLSRLGFVMYNPENQWVGPDFIYWIKDI